MSPSEIKDTREWLGLTASEFGQALGFSDAAREIRALETGSRKGKEVRLSGPARKALDYLLAINRCVRKIEHTDDVAGAMQELCRAIPQKLRSRRACI